MTYVTDGRPSAIAVDRADLSDACTRSASALGHVALIDPATAVSSGGIQWLTIQSARGVMGCADAPRPELGLPTSPPAPETEGDIRDPQKSRHVAPSCPGDALRRGVAGTVVLEALISREGCIQSAHTLRSVDPFLAMRAVVQWRYKPAQQNGGPVDGLMTVTVNFVL